MVFPKLSGAFSSSDELFAGLWFVWIIARCLEHDMGCCSDPASGIRGRQIKPVACIFHMLNVHFSFQDMSTRSLCAWLSLCIYLRVICFYICMFLFLLVVCVCAFVFARLVWQVACAFCLWVCVCTYMCVFCMCTFVGVRICVCVLYHLHLSSAHL